MNPLAWLVAGITLRILWAAVQLQWFHPDERQLFEFAHYHAHGQLHPFLEVELGSRNQTWPWIFSILWRFLDSLHLGSIESMLFITHALLGVLFFWALWRAHQTERQLNQKTESPWEILALLSCGWFLIYFGGRALLESLSTTAVLFAWIAYRKKIPALFGILLGVAAFTRYPSALFLVGGFFLMLRQRSLKSTLQFCGGAIFALIAGGIADRIFYGSFYHSAFSYWAYNHPGGPVEQTFGTDSLSVYYRFFDFALSPWVTPVFLLVLLAVLLKNRVWLIFLAPYLAGHLITSHREPRFMIPILVLGFVAGLARWNPSNKKIRFALRTQLLFWLVWGILQATAQLASNQAALLHAASLNPRVIYAGLDRPIDAFFSMKQTNWLDERCEWQRNEPQVAENSEITVIARETPDALACKPLNSPFHWVQSEHWSRWLRSRPGNAYGCEASVLKKLCPQGVAKSEPDHPWKKSLQKSL